MEIWVKARRSDVRSASIAGVTVAQARSEARRIVNSTKSTLRAKLVLLAFPSSSFSSNSKSTSEMHFLALRNVDGASLDNVNPTYFPNTCASLVSCAGASPVAA